MRTYSFTLAGARLAYLLTITRVDETVIRLTNYANRITISGDIFYPEPGLEIGDLTETNNGEVSNLTFKVAMGGLFAEDDVNNRLFERAEARLYFTNATAPSLADIEFVGKLNGDASFDLDGNVQFEILNKFAVERDVFVRKNTIEDDVDFGDPVRSKIPTFPTVDETSDDLADVERSTEYALGARVRFRFAGAGNPSDYADRYLEATAITTGVTAGSAPTPSSTVGSTYVDGGVTWTTRDALARAFQVASIVDESHIIITVTEPRATDDTWFAPGMIVMRSGTMKNFASDVDAYDQGTDQISLVVPFGNLLEVGDWGEIAPDYDQTLDMAVDKYGSALTSLTEPNSADGGANNYRGLPHLTGAGIAASTFIAGVTVDNAEDGDDPGAGGGEGGGGYSAFAVEFEAGSD